MAKSLFGGAVKTSAVKPAPLPIQKAMEPSGAKKKVEKV